MTGSKFTRSGSIGRACDERNLSRLLPIELRGKMKGCRHGFFERHPSRKYHAGCTDDCCCGSAARIDGDRCAQAKELSRALQNSLRCYIVDGWITFEESRLANIGPFYDGTRRVAGQETLNVRNENGQCVLSYERRSNEDQLTLEVTVSADRVLVQVLLRRAPRAGSAVLPIEFKQVANERITLALGSGSGQHVFRTRSLWQLLMTQPKECQQHLLPLLEVLRPNWNLADTAARVEERLLQEADGDADASRAPGPPW